MGSSVSAGDVIALSILIKDVIKALDDSSGASTEYQEITRELWSLDKALLESNADYTFLDKIKLFDRSLRPRGSGSRLRDTARKIQWSFAQKDELAKFRTEINGHASAINMLLITASISYTRLTGRNFEHRLDGSDSKQGASSKEVLSLLGEIQTKVRENGTQLEEHGKQLDAQGQAGSRLMDGMQYFATLSTDLQHFMTSMLKASRHSYKVLLDVQSRIPREFQHCWIQEPVVLTDALGRVATIHLELIGSWDVFDSVLAARFSNLPGQVKIQRKEIVFQDRFLEKDVERSQPFESCFLPGRRIDMSMVFEQKNPYTSCPKCGLKADYDSERGIKCMGCNLWVQRVEEVIDDSTIRSPAASRADAELINLHSRNEASKKQKRVTGSGEEDDIRSFQRVRLLLKFGQSSRPPQVDPLKCRKKSKLLSLIGIELPERTYNRTGFHYEEEGSQEYQNNQGFTAELPYNDFFEPDSATPFPNPYTIRNFYDWLFEGENTNNTSNTPEPSPKQPTGTSDPQEMSINRQGHLDPWSIGDDYLSTLLASADDTTDWTEFSHSSHFRY